MTPTERSEREAVAIGVCLRETRQCLCATDGRFRHCQNRLEIADVAIAALDAHRKQQGVSGGVDMVLVPRIPTPEMCEAGLEEIPYWVKDAETARLITTSVANSNMTAEIKRECITEVWQAMLAAATGDT